MDQASTEAIPPKTAELPPRSLAQQVADLERCLITQALTNSRGVQQRAAELLRMPVRTLFNKIRRYDLLHLLETRSSRRTIAQNPAAPETQAQPLRESHLERAP